MFNKNLFEIFTQAQKKQSRAEAIERTSCFQCYCPWKIDKQEFL